MLSIKILLISADGNLARTVNTCLQQAGYKVIHTSRGSAFLELIRTEQPSLIILDIQLPDYNSMAIIRSLRSESFNQQMPIILMGANMREEDVLIGLEVGADLCLREIFHPEVFVARVRSLLRRTELQKENTL